SAQAGQTASGPGDTTAEAAGSGGAGATHIELRPNGPIVVHNECMIRYADGRQEMREAKVFLCRCGASYNKPFCDGSHKKTGFEG
ncbi:MAG: CDGSH iron-sulfur domain-containing protein, partial [Bacteroidetes bacterium]|nr:CDGSH iron-sulfur domain-containing protein [Bacteroidota bacterium]